MKNPFGFFGAGLLSFGMAVSHAQTAPSVPPGTSMAPPDAATLPPSSPFARWGANFTFLFDAYADQNFNNPGSGANDLRGFDVLANSAQLNMAMVSIDRPPAPVGFHVDAGFGRAFEIIHASDRMPDRWEYLKQAYISLKPKSWRGLEVDAGQFVTSAGAEVMESSQNWNYSRSLLFAWAIPYYHFGIRASFPIGTHFTAGAQIVNGWNNIENTQGTAKTVGINGAYAWKKVTWTNVYYGGLETDGPRLGRRQLYDTTVQVNPTDRLSYYVNFDYGHARNLAGAQQWTGIAGAARQAIGKSYAIAVRAEWFDDANGFMTGKPQAIQEVTLTGEYKVTNWLLSRLEFRDDWSNRTFCKRENADARNQPTILAGLIATFGRGK
jgi:Putative beta-barrel porin-2, OmpL-like. bbp2